ncbi:MAG TPA: cupin domain-containing protein [Fimbriimonas sp.]
MASYGFRGATDAPIVHESWGTLQWLANADAGNVGGLTLGQVTIFKGRSNPRHRHNRCEEVLYLLEGRLIHTVGDRTYDMNPGDTLTIPPGVFHNATSTGDIDALMIVAYDSAERDFEREQP